MLMLKGAAGGLTMEKLRLLPSSSLAVTMTTDVPLEASSGTLAAIRNTPGNVNTVQVE